MQGRRRFSGCFLRAGNKRREAVPGGARHGNERQRQHAAAMRTYSGAAEYVKEAKGRQQESSLLVRQGGDGSAKNRLARVRVLWR